LVAPGPKGAIKILPDMKDDERLPPSEVAHLVRVLHVHGFDHCFIDDSNLPDYGYRPDKPS
jgi:hypothetical protein